MAATQGPETVAAVLTAAMLAVVPDLGHYVLMVVGGWIGCMHSVAKMDFDGSKTAAMWYMLRWIGTACVLTGAVSAAIVSYTGFPADRWPGVVAFAITFLADKWMPWADALMPQWLSTLFKKQQ